MEFQILYLLTLFIIFRLAYSPSGGGSNGRRAWINGVEKTVSNTAAGNVTAAGTSTIGIDNSLVKWSIRYVIRFYKILR